MERSVWQQVQELFNRATAVLIVLPKQPSTDAIASGLALFLLLEKMGKKATVVSDEFALPDNHAFLPGSNVIKPDLAASRKFTITLNLAQAKVEDLSYDIKEDKLNIYITPKQGMFRDEDLHTEASKTEYDLIVVLDAADFESLGATFDNHTELFYNTPIINIDHRAANTNFGQVNIVELTATSTSEVLFSLVQEMNPQLLDEHAATNLLAGIISKTKSFQSSNVTPKSLAVAGHLIASGARRDEIIRHLYQTKPLHTLRLWGRVLSRLKSEHQERFLWSRLSKEEIEQSKSGIDDLPGVIDELIIDAPKAEIIALLTTNANGETHALVHTRQTLNGMMLFREFQPEGTREFMTLRFPGMNAEDAEKQLLRVVHTHFQT